MRKLFLALAVLFSLSINWTAFAQTPTPTINGTPPPFVFTGAVTQTGQTFNFTGGSGTFVTLSGDATSTATGGATTVVGIEGHAIAAPSTAAYIHWSGSAWEYANPSGSMTYPGIGIPYTSNGSSWGTSLTKFGTAAGLATSTDPGTTAEVPMVADGTHGQKPSANGALGTGAFAAVLPQANSTTSGYLLSTDWSTFNGREPALGNPGTDGYVLSSTHLGVRSWVPNGTGGGVTSFNSRTGAVIPVQNDYTGLTVTQWALGINNTTLAGGMTASEALYGPIPAAMGYTLPANGATTSPIATSQLLLGTLPAATWVATILRYPAATAGCQTSAPVTVGIISIATSGAQFWSTISTGFSIGDCLQINAPSSVDTTAANPNVTLVVVK